MQKIGYMLIKSRSVKYKEEEKYSSNSNGSRKSIERKQNCITEKEKS